MALGPMFDDIAKVHHASGVIAARSGTAPLLGVWRPNARVDTRSAVAWNNSVIDLIREQRIPAVMLIAKWDMYVEGRLTGEIDPLLGVDAATRATPDSALRTLNESLRRTIDALQALGCRVLVLKQIPVQHFNPQPAVVAAALLHRPIPRGVSRAEHDLQKSRVNAVIDSAIRGRANVAAFDPAGAWFDADGDSRLGDATGSYYRDDDHVSDWGAKQLMRPQLEPALLKLLTPNTR
jgi:hypothetical protein